MVGGSFGTAWYALLLALISKDFKGGCGARLCLVQHRPNMVVSSTTVLAILSTRLDSIGDLCLRLSIKTFLVSLRVLGR